MPYDASTPFYADQVLLSAELSIEKGAPRDAVAAIARLEDERPAAALRPDIQYALGVALLENGDTARARSVLSAITEEPQASAAARLLDDIGH